MPPPEASPGESAPVSDNILAIDIGGTGLKASILDRGGEMLTERFRVETPHPCPPGVCLEALSKLVAPLRDYGRVSVGFPGVVRNGKVLTAPNLGTEAWRGFDLAKALSQHLKRPVRVLNDAEVQGFAAIRGKGLEVVITLGTGFGTALFADGRIGPHLELSHHPFRKGETYDQQLGNAAYEEIGKKRWNKRVARAIETLRILTTFDRLYIGGGNAKRINFELPPDVKVVSNALGIRGGAFLWRE